MIRISSPKHQRNPNYFLLPAILLISWISGSSHAFASSTIESIRQKNFLTCGVNSNLEGFSSIKNSRWHGADVDLCRGLATIVLNDPKKVKFVPLSEKEQLVALQSGKVDILARNKTWTKRRDTNFGLSFAGVLYFDELGVMVRERALPRSVIEQIKIGDLQHADLKTGIQPPSEQSKAIDEPPKEETTNKTNSAVPSNDNESNSETSDSTTSDFETSDFEESDFDPADFEEQSDFDPSAIEAQSEVEQPANANNNPPAKIIANESAQPKKDTIEISENNEYDLSINPSDRKYLLPIHSGEKQKNLSQLTEVNLCLEKRASNAAKVKAWFYHHRLKLKTTEFTDQNAMVNGLLSGKCNGIVADKFDLYSLKKQLAGHPETWHILPDSFSVLPIGPLVRQDDLQWFNLVRWTLFALVHAETLGISSENSSLVNQSKSPLVQQFIGNTQPDDHAHLINSKWTLRLIEAVGNYGEIFERNFGKQSGLNIERGINHLWINGGLMWSPSFQ